MGFLLGLKLNIQIARIKRIYENELNEARRLLDESSKKSSEAELKLSNLMEKTQELEKDAEDSKLKVCFHIDGQA